jgi:hypothetical protein
MMIIYNSKVFILSISIEYNKLKGILNIFTLFLLDLKVFLLNVNIY